MCVRNDIKNELVDQEVAREECQEEMRRILAVVTSFVASVVPPFARILFLKHAQSASSTFRRVELSIVQYGQYR